METKRSIYNAIASIPAYQTPELPCFVTDEETATPITFAEFTKGIYPFLVKEVAPPAITLRLIANIWNQGIVNFPYNGRTYTIQVAQDKEKYFIHLSIDIVKGHMFSEPRYSSDSQTTAFLLPGS